ncbi:hypothetical protein EVAR_16440_1 [Eumeta japonica]|uniref:Uncharacterized protein n=1 Tax=Eumeta variegata TaxID=151549 RepID=A0A4C1UL24_EUMVA|nr:hypothetical protein EVAR_16440_1 [Eumeta japonica]
MYPTHTCRRMRHLQIAARLVHPSIKFRVVACGVQGPPRSQKSLPTGELNILFIKFLKQQGYEDISYFSKIENVLDVAVSRVNSRDPSLCLSACTSGKRSSSAISSDDGSISDKSDSTIKGSGNKATDFFKLLKRSRKVACRLRKSSNSDSNDSSMEVENNFKKPVIHKESPASSALSLTKKTIPAPKRSTVGVKNSSKNEHPVNIEPVNLCVVNLMIRKVRFYNNFHN